MTGGSLGDFLRELDACQVVGCTRHSTSQVTVRARKGAETFDVCTPHATRHRRGKLELKAGQLVDPDQVVAVVDHRPTRPAHHKRPSKTRRVTDAEILAAIPAQGATSLEVTEALGNAVGQSAIYQRLCKLKRDGELTHESKGRQSRWRPTGTPVVEGVEEAPAPGASAPPPAEPPSPATPGDSDRPQPGQVLPFPGPSDSDTDEDAGEHKPAVPSEYGPLLDFARGRHAELAVHAARLELALFETRSALAHLGAALEIAKSGEVGQAAAILRGHVAVGVVLP